MHRGQTCPRGPELGCVPLGKEKALLQRVRMHSDRRDGHRKRHDLRRRGRGRWLLRGVIVVVESLDQAADLTNQLAAEHVEIAVAAPEPLFGRIRHAGSMFLGRHTPEAVGDYVAGPNHVLPTGRRARFASGLSVLDFMKRTSFMQLDEAALQAVGPAAIALADAEGLPAHARSIEVRLGI